MMQCSFAILQIAQKQIYPSKVKYYPFFPFESIFNFNVWSIFWQKLIIMWKSIPLGGMYPGEEKNRTVAWKPQAQVHGEFSVHATEAYDLLIYAKCLYNLLDGYLAEKIKYCHSLPFKEWSNQFWSSKNWCVHFAEF